MAGHDGAVSGAFNRFEPADVRDLIAEYPLAWVTARSTGGASLLPLLGEHDAAGRLVSLLGHMSRRNPLAEALAVDPRAIILVTGPSAYISPDQAERRDWAPTWNYAQATIGADVAFMPDEADGALAALTDAMEKGRWTSAELGPRYAGMARSIVAFRAHVTAIDARFKLGQDERPEVFASIARNHPDRNLVRWMTRFRR